MTDLPTLIAELEEAERAATPGPWEFLPDEYYQRPGPIVLHFTDVDADEDGRPMDCGEDICEMADTQREEANARLIALMRTHLPALIEAVKRRDALIAEMIGKARISLMYNPDNKAWATFLNEALEARTALGEDQ